ncbi:WbqC-like protein family protein [Myroides marinus]|uniref:WbqC-like protein family protein n=1 Tax=Myroides marinus TaxID=703342 RepID=A0A1H6XJ09_9FLAO|nr:WbqC family protein [Myroides marinus]SEJ29088.1 WbqC-like protein family protein [Myroides marinus]
MKIAIMQPYFLPYIGYIQLINAVDKFVIYDDVNYIKGGWINRNNLLLNNQKFLFTVPLEGSSAFKKIDEIVINKRLYDKWCKKLLISIEQSYKKAPYFSEVFLLLKKIVEIEETISISEYNYNSIILICKFLNIKTEIIKSSRIYDNIDLSRESRIYDICSKENSKSYVNPIGGMELYNKESFLKEGIKLNFLKTNEIVYKQFENEFVPWLSIIDVMMFNDVKEIKDMLEQYELV